MKGRGRPTLGEGEEGSGLAYYLKASWEQTKQGVKNAGALIGDIAKYHFTTHPSQQLTDAKEFYSNPDNWASATSVEIKRCTRPKGNQVLSEGTSKTIKTPYGDAVQSPSKEALQLRRHVDSGGQLYRGGTFGRSNVTNAQFWAPENPLNPGYEIRS